MLWEPFFLPIWSISSVRVSVPLNREPFMGPSHEYKVRIRDYHFTTHIAYSFFQAGSSLLHRYTVFIASTTVLLSRFRRKCSLTILSNTKAPTSIFSRIKKYSHQYVGKGSKIREKRKYQEMNEIVRLLGLNFKGPKTFFVSKGVVSSKEPFEKMVSKKS